MARTNTRRTTPSGVRRTLGVAGTTGLVGGLALVGMGAIAAPHADAAAKPLSFHCKANVFGSVVDLKEWSVVVTTTAPDTVTPGQALSAPKVTAAVTVSQTTMDTLKGLNIGWVKSKTNFNSPYKVFNTDFNADMSLPVTPVPTSGLLTTTASGLGEATTAPEKVGTYPITVGDFSVDLLQYRRDQDPSTTPASEVFVAPTSCVYDGPTGENVIGSITVKPAATSTSSSPSTSTSTTSEPTSTTTTTSEPTQTTTTTSEPTETTTTTSEPTETTTTTSEPTETTTTTPEPTSTTTTPEPTGTATSSTSSVPVITPSTVQTGSVGSSSGNNMLTAAGLGLTAISVVAVGGAVVAGRKREQR